MQLTTIALATILISSVATTNPKKPKNISSSLKTRMAAFETLGEGQPEGPSKKQEHSLAGSRSSASATKPKPTPGPSVRIFPPPTPKTEKESEKPTPSSAKKPAAIFRTAPPSSSTVSPASTPTPPKPFAKPTPPASFPGAKVDPRSGEKPHASRVAGLRERWESPSTSESTPIPKSVGAPLSPPAKTTGTAAKLPLGPAKKSATTFYSGQTSSSKVSSAPTPAPSKPIATLKSAPILLPPSGTPSGPPQQFRKEQESQSLSAQSSPTLKSASGTFTVKERIALAKRLEKGFLEAAEREKMLESRGKGTSSATRLTPPVTVPSSMSSTSALNSQTFKRFKEALQDHDFGDAWTVYHTTNGETRKQCGEYFVNRKYNELVQVIDSISEHIYKAGMLGIALAHANDDLFNKILDEWKPNDDLLGESVYNNVDLACNLKRFMTVLKRIIKPFRRKWAIGRGVDALFDKYKTEFLALMISALENEESLDPDLTNYAIQRAFEKASSCTDHRLSLVRDFHDGSKVSAGDYVDAMNLIYCDKWLFDKNHEHFRWLVDMADRDDLYYYKNCSFFRNLSPEDQNYVNDRLKSVEKDPETRQERGERRKQMKKVLESFDEIRGHKLPPVLTSIINEYITSRTFANSE